MAKSRSEMGVQGCVTLFLGIGYGLAYYLGGVHAYIVTAIVVSIIMGFLLLLLAAFAE